VEERNAIKLGRVERITSENANEVPALSKRLRNQFDVRTKSQPSRVILGQRTQWSTQRPGVFRDGRKGYSYDSSATARGKKENTGRGGS